MSKERRRRLSRDSHRSERKQFTQDPWQFYEYIDPPLTRLGSDGVEAVIDTAYRILEELGIAYLDPQAVTEMKAAGAEVDSRSNIVRIPRDMVTDYMRDVPASFRVTPRNPQRAITIGGKTPLFTAVGSPPFAMDCDNGRRPGNFEDYSKFVKLAQQMNNIHLLLGYPVEPQDIHASTRHLYAFQEMILCTDKVFKLYSLGYERICDGLEMARIASGKSWEQLETAPTVMTNINSSSPLRIDQPMLIGLRECSKRLQPCVITPFTLSGAMAPITLAGALAQQTAEALAGIVFTQVIRRGTPVVYGGFTPNVDMKSGAPAFGTPESVRSAIASGEITRYFSIPYRSSAVCTSNAPDAQAAYETVYSLWGAVHGHAHLIFHAAGWLEGGLIASFEKFIIDCDIISTFLHSLKPIAYTAEDRAFDAVKEVGHQGHFFGISHTLQRYETEYWQPLNSDWQNYESWELAGSKDTMMRANALYKKLLHEYEPPPIDPAIREELSAFVTRRVQEGGSPTDF